MRQALRFPAKYPRPIGRRGPRNLLTLPVMRRNIFPIIKEMQCGGFFYGKKTFIFLLLLSCLFPLASGAQEAGQAAAESGALPRNFRELTLGMSLDELKAGLEKDALFNFRGDRDVSFLPARDQSLVETTGSLFIKRAFFQLRDGSLYIMAFSLNTAEVDHYSTFTQLVAKYGQPSYLDPKEAIWETGDTRIALERPLTVKYIDKKVFDDIINESLLGESRQVRLRQEFLDEF